MKTLRELSKDQGDDNNISGKTPLEPRDENHKVAEALTSTSDYQHLIDCMIKLNAEIESQKATAASSKQGFFAHKPASANTNTTAVVPYSAANAKIAIPENRLTVLATQETALTTFVKR